MLNLISECSMRKIEIDQDTLKTSWEKSRKKEQSAKFDGTDGSGLGWFNLPGTNWWSFLPLYILWLLLFSVNCIFCYFLFSALLPPSLLDKLFSPIWSLLKGPVSPDGRYWLERHTLYYTLIWNTQKYTHMWCLRSWEKKLFLILGIWYGIFKK